MALTAPPRVCGRCFQGRASATVSATRSPSSRRNCGDRVACAPGLALPVPHPGVPGTTAEGLARVCAGPVVAALCGSRHHHSWGANGARGRHWIQEKKAGWYAVLADPQMPVTSTLLDQAHNAIERKLFAMKGFHHPGGSPRAFLTGLAHLYNLIPYQRRAQHAGQCGVEVEGGRVPPHDWMLNLQILTSGGFR